MSRSSAFVTVTCDRCQRESVEIELARIGLDISDLYVDDELERIGWQIDNGEEVCPGCHEEDEDVST